jgi:hypothetical protein
MSSLSSGTPAGSDEGLATCACSMSLLKQAMSVAPMMQRRRNDVRIVMAIPAGVSIKDEECASKDEGVRLPPYSFSLET